MENAVSEIMEKGLGKYNWDVRGIPVKTTFRMEYDRWYQGRQRISPMKRK